MQPFINLAIYVDKSGDVELDTPFSELVPQPLVEINFLMSDVATWIRFKNKDGRTYALYLPALVPMQYGVMPDNLSETQLLSTGNDWQGNPLPSPAPAEAVIRWYGH
jgi:hypothetical protein